MEVQKTALCLSGCKPLFEVSGKLGNGRIIEEVGDFDLPWIHVFDALVNLRQGERARPQLEDIVVDADRLVLEITVADLLEACLELGRRGRRGARSILAIGLQGGNQRVE